MAVDLADMFTVPIGKTLGLAMVIVPVTDPVSSNTAVSCAKGKLFAPGVPPLVSAHPVAFQFCAPARFQYTVLGVLKVIPVLPFRSPMRVPEDHDAAPVAVQSLKSTSVKLVNAAALIVKTLPCVCDTNAMR